ncbi:MAG: ABC transporter permease [Gemmatimonadota bacterium]
MMWLTRVRSWLSGLVGRSRFEREMSAEMAHHLELEVRDRVAAGMGEVEARRTALRDFGGVERWKEESRAARGFSGWDALWQDLRYGLRTLRGSPAFTLVAVATLAVGIGATTAVFSVVDGLLLRPLAYRQPDRIVRLLSYAEDGSGRGTISAPDYYDWMEQSTAFESGALYDEYSPTLMVEGAATKVNAASVGASYFDVLGVRPAVGRFFLPAEDAGGSARVVLSWGLWHDVFGGDPGVVGRVIDLSGFPYTVVGVASPMEDPGLSGASWGAPRLWRSTPRYFRTNGRGSRSFTAIARLRPGVTREQAESQLRAIQARLAKEYPAQDANRVPRIASLKDDMVGGVRPVLWVLLAAVGLVLLIACANVANLLLFRAAARGREMAMRTALGASRGRVVRQLMVESLLLALLGAVAGVGLAVLATKALMALAAGQLPRAEAVGIDVPVLGFALAVACGAAFLFGLLPALHTTRVDLRGALGDGGRGTTSGSQGRLRTGVVAAQVAMAVVVMLGAGLLGRSLLRLQAVDPGVAASRALVMRIDPPPDPYDPSTDAGERSLFGLYDRIDRRLAALPGVQAVGMVDLLPMSGSFDGNPFLIVGRPTPEPGHLPSEETRAISPGYFDAMGIPLTAGRNVRPSDNGDEDAENVVVVNQSFVRRYFPDGGALGAQLRMFGPHSPPARIVGIVGDVTQFSLDRAPQPVLYLPQAQAPAWQQDEPWIVLRTNGDPATLTSAARSAIHQIEPRTPVYSAQPMKAVVSATLARPRFRTFLLLAFAGIAFLLAAIGVYGMVAYAVSRRLPEIGVRMAMGADARRILRHVLGQGLWPVLLGGGVGLLAGLAAVRLLAGFLFQVGAADPVTFVAVPLSLAAVAALAALLPARRAARTSPARVLRAE